MSMDTGSRLAETGECASDQTMPECKIAAFLLAALSLPKFPWSPPRVQILATLVALLALLQALLWIDNSRRVSFHARCLIAWRKVSWHRPAALACADKRFDRRGCGRRRRRSRRRSTVERRPGERSDDAIRRQAASRLKPDDRRMSHRAELAIDRQQRIGSGGVQECLKLGDQRPARANADRRSRCGLDLPLQVWCASPIDPNRPQQETHPLVACGSLQLPYRGHRFTTEP